MKSNIYDIEFTGIIPISQHNDEELQRTEKWFKDRCGRFTGSEIKKLMGCTTLTGKLEWGHPDKLLDFNETSIKYIYSKAMERKTGIVVRLTDNINFKYGRKAEPIIIKRMLTKNNITFKQMPFVIINDYLGASPDGQLMGVIDNEFGFEAKGAMNWETYYTRTELPLDENHMDFWQVQTEMLALKCKILYYVTSYPVPNAIDFITAEDEDAEKMIIDVKTRIVKASEIHQNAILQRAEIANDAIEIFLKGTNIHEAIRLACLNFELCTN